MSDGGEEKSGAPDEGDVHAHGPVCGGAVVADEHAVRRRRPRGVARGAVEAHLTDMRGSREGYGKDSHSQDNGEQRK